MPKDLLIGLVLLAGLVMGILYATAKYSIRKNAGHFLLPLVMWSMDFVVSASIVIMLLSLSTNAFAQDVKTYVPPAAKLLIPVVQEEQDKFFPELPMKHYFGGLIEQESCISLKHSKCWNQKAELKSKREYGAGVGQLTKAFNKDGSLRFDSLYESRKRHESELRELSWSTIKDRPDLQIRTMVLMSRDNYRGLASVSDPEARMHFTDAAYNGGLGGVQKERRFCGLSKSCDPQKWFGNVENKCLKSNTALYGQRSACFINREHVHNVFLLRTNKYATYLF